MTTSRTGRVSKTQIHALLEESKSSRRDQLKIAGAPKAGVGAMGVPLAVEQECWLPSLNAVTVSERVDDGAVINRLLTEHGIEIVGGFGALSGEISRVGCVGCLVRPTNITNFIVAFGNILDDEGTAVDVREGAAAMTTTLGEQY